MARTNTGHTRKTPLTLAAWLLVCALAPAASRAKEWRGITPAVSTRADVVRLFGQCSDPKKSCEFAAADGFVSVTFSGEVVSLYPSAAQLPDDTVLLVRVSSGQKLKVEDVEAGGVKLRKFNNGSVPVFESFIDEEAGLLAQASGGAVSTLIYIASAVDRFRCPAFYENSERFAPVYLCILPAPTLRLVAAYGNIGPGDERAALDQLVRELSDEPGAQAYVIAYGGRRSRPGDARRRAERARAYLTSERGVDEGRLVILDGGYRDEASVELFAVPAGAAPPTPAPTVDPKDVQTAPVGRVKKPSHR